MMRTTLAILCAIFTKSLIKLLNRGHGEAAPGLVALKIDPQYIYNRQKDIPLRIVISGTNGKTTTTHLLGKILLDQQKTLITNPHGSNLSRGVAAALTIKNTADATLWETDEAAFVEICEQTRPTHIVLLNLFRDQLDRYGEVDSTVKKWLNVLKKLPSLTLIFNCDDPNLEYIARKCPQHRLVRFGIREVSSNKNDTPEAHGDAIFCPVCGKPLHFSFVSFSHLGIYSCTCGFKRGKPDFAFSGEGSHIKVDSLDIQSKLEGSYSAYNITAAVALASSLELNTKQLLESILQFKPSFGRQEVMQLGEKLIKLLLIKNPTGASQNLEILKNQKKDYSLLIAINDRLADGRDVSWLWDTNFENLNARNGKIIVSGTRCLDMAVRLKYAGLSEEKIIVEPDLNKAVKRLLKTETNLIYILPTYTSMREIRQILISEQKNLESKITTGEITLKPIEPAISPAVSVVNTKQK